MAKKNKRKKLDNCHHRYCWDSQVYCLHQLFRKNIVQAVVRQEDEHGHASFSMWESWNPRYQSGPRWALHGADQVELAIELAKHHHVLMIRA